MKIKERESPFEVFFNGESPDVGAERRDMILENLIEITHAASLIDALDVTILKLSHKRDQIAFELRA